MPLQPSPDIEQPDLMPQDPSDRLQTFVRLITQHQGVIRAFIVSLMPGSPSIADVLQETNMVLWKKRDCLRAESEFVTWAFTVARYEVMHHRDRVKRDDRVMFSDQMVELLADDEDQWNTTESGDASLEVLEDCMSKLTGKERDLIEFRYTPGKSLQQYAEETGASASSLRISLMRIRRNLKLCVETHLALRIP
ncbi:sigma-70 family RNA polymerase sigma factor [Luteolibacter pohnpeiensis]|uniref:Sigma-70 family RNA polymerase sigma factor n=1 Tax=Luteolibacter pohnpeiensis TaxID=454153 RepID=A0A934SDU9_9BACT|nr:sigma-70 family RNA polymerase sigma factor [Luteolibacter pohnpeiensis]MBK1884307.1 sigma-70 family RNA polymerase sigma factor [Luteolibacter pohnpeiensis]